jgi:sugar phosphate isomerase/epimerase
MCTAAWDLDRDLEFYRDHGITNVGIALRKLEAAGLPQGSQKVIDHGLRVTNLLGLGFALDKPQAWPQHQERLEAAVGAAADMGAEVFLLTTGEAGARGVTMALEHTNSLRVDVGFVHTLRDMVDLARMVGTGVVMECNACWAERDLASTIAAGIDTLRLVQVSDFVIGTLTTPQRVVPGDGDIPLERIIGWLLDAGYGGVFDLEIMGPRIEDEGYDRAVPRAVDVLTRWLEGFGA